jgi:putative ABC transport system permease protein
MIWLRIAVRNLLQAGRRTAFLGTALLLVTFLLVMLLSLAGGVADTMIKTASAISAGHVNIGGFYKMSQGESAALVTDVAKLREIARTSTPGFVSMVDRARGWGKLISDSGSQQMGVNGIDFDEEKDLVKMLVLAPEREYVEGGGDRVVGDLSKMKQPGHAIIFASQAKNLAVGPGDPLTIRSETMRGQSNTAEVTVAAVVRDMGMLSSWSAFVDKQTIRDLYQLKPDTTGVVQIYIQDPDQSALAMVELQKGLEAAGYKVMEHESNPFWMKLFSVGGEDWTGQKLDLTTWSDEVSFLLWVLTAIRGISFFLITILTVIIAVGIMNTMWIAVRERTREVGTLRAIGMGRPRVLLMFLLEALILGFVATSLGGLLGAAAATAIDAARVQVPSDAMIMILMSDTLHLVPTAAQVVGSVVAFTLVTGASALWPAARAARITPVTAIQSVE